MRRDDPPIFRGPAETVEHAIRSRRDANDGFPAVSFVAEIRGHHTDNEGATTGEDDAGIVADAFELAGLIGDAQIFRQFPRNVAFLMDAEKIEKILGELL